MTDNQVYAVTSLVVAVIVIVALVFLAIYAIRHGYVVQCRANSPLGGVDINAAPPQAETAEHNQARKGGKKAR